MGFFFFFGEIFCFSSVNLTKFAIFGAKIWISQKKGKKKEKKSSHHLSAIATTNI
jgi:hypothetical protein